MWLNRDHSTPEKCTLIRSALNCFLLYSTSKKKKANIYHTTTTTSSFLCWTSELFFILLSSLGSLTYSCLGFHSHLFNFFELLRFYKINTGWRFNTHLQSPAKELQSWISWLRQAMRDDTDTWQECTQHYVYTTSETRYTPSQQVVSVSQLGRRSKRKPYLKGFLTLS